MALTRTNIIGRITLPDDTNPVNSVVRFTMTGFDTEAGADATVIPIPVDATIDALGNIDVNLWPNPLGVRTTFYSVVAKIPDGNTIYTIDIYLGQISVPSTGGPYDLNDLLPITPPAGADVADYIAQLAAAVALAQSAAGGVFAAAAEASATSAELAAIAAGAAIYADTAAGLAGTISGDVFLVPDANGMIVYENDTGVAVSLGRFRPAVFDSIAIMATATGLLDGQFATVNSGFNGTPETFQYAAASTATADGGLIVAATGMGGVGRLISQRKTLATVPDLLTGDLRGYETYTAGEAVEAEGFRYKVALAGASDQHLTTAGGVKLYLEADRSGYLHLRGLGLLADGADENTRLQAVVAFGLDLDFGGRASTYGITAPLAMTDGQKFKAAGATIKALAAIDNCITRDSNTVVDGLAIDCNNTQPASGVPITQTGAIAGMSFENIVGTKTRNCTLTKYKQGLRIVSTVLGTPCTDHDVTNCVAVAGFDWAGSRSSNQQVGAYVGSTASAATTVISDFTGTLMNECADVSAITFENWHAYEGQYGLALHRCSNVTVNGGLFRRMSRAISIQQQSRNITVNGPVIKDVDSTGVHIAYGARQVTVTACQFSGTMGNDNVCVQGYYGVKDITVTNNVMDSRFDLWDGGGFSENRVPASAMRFGQQAENITVSGNKVRGYLRGVDLKSTIYEDAITIADPNYYFTGFRNVTVRDNSVLGDYYTAATGNRLQLATSQTYGVHARITGDWEDVAEGGWNIENVLIENNSAKLVAFSYIVETATMSGGATPPVFETLGTVLRSNKSIERYVTDVSRTSVSDPLAVTYDGNSWADFQTWTPIIYGSSTAGTQTYSAQLGQWSVKGNTLTIDGRIALSAKDGAIAGDARIGGLPAPCAISASRAASGCIGLLQGVTLITNYNAVGLQAEHGLNFLRLLRLSTTGFNAGYLGVTELSGTMQINFQASYEVAA